MFSKTAINWMLYLSYFTVIFHIAWLVFRSVEGGWRRVERWAIVVGLSFLSLFFFWHVLKPMTYWFLLGGD